MLRVPDCDRLALFLDVDGTLVNIAERPDDVWMPSGLVDLLRSLERRLDGAIALVSGRAIDDLDQLFDPLRLRAAGVHGAETRVVPGGAIQRSAEDELSPQLLSDLETSLLDFPGVTIENKRRAYAVHYRAVPDVGPRLGAVVRRFADTRSGLVVLPGHCIFELKHPSHTKGTAISAFMRSRPFAGRRPLFIGDDITDMAGFEAVRGLGGTTYSVAREMPGVDGWFESPADVREWLERIVSVAAAVS